MEVGLTSSCIVRIIPNKAKRLLCALESSKSGYSYVSSYLINTNKLSSLNNRNYFLKRQPTVMFNFCFEKTRYQKTCFSWKYSLTQNKQIVRQNCIELYTHVCVPKKGLIFSGYDIRPEARISPGQIWFNGLLFWSQYLSYPSVKRHILHFLNVLGYLNKRGFGNVNFSSVLAKAAQNVWLCPLATKGPRLWPN